MGVRSYPSKKKMLLGQQGNALMALIAINAIVFVLINFIKIAFLMSDETVASYQRLILAWWLVPADLGTLLSRPWTLLTYHFTNDSVWLLISNLLWLWAFGGILQSLTGNRHLAPLYMYGGFVGAIAYLLTVNIFPALQANIAYLAPLQGAGTGVMAVAVGTTAMAPNYRLLPMLNGGIPIWVLTLVWVLVDYSMVASIGAGAAVAHLAAGAAGLLYISALKRGVDRGEWMHQLSDWFTTLFEPATPKNRPQQERQKMHYKSGPAPYQTKAQLTQQRIDEILDKINVKGYLSLSDEEKELLKRAGKEDI
jgi:membrane associated rhomboid family serine protease